MRTISLVSERVQREAHLAELVRPRRLEPLGMADGEPAVAAAAGGGLQPHAVHPTRDAGDFRPLGLDRLVLQAGHRGIEPPVVSGNQEEGDAK